LRGILGLSAAIVALAGRANAHAFQGGAEPYSQFIEGAGVIVTYPGILLPIVAMGVAISLWNPDGLPRVWAFGLLGQAVGVFVAPYLGPWVAAAFIALGVIVAGLAAIWPESRRAVITAMTGLIGFGAMVAALQGHGLFELSLFIHLGILFGANMCLAAGAGAAALALEKVPAHWMHVTWRVVASWIGAILMLFLAFSLRGVS
jgi:hypothetical protein